MTVNQLFLTLQKTNETLTQEDVLNACFNIQQEKLNFVNNKFIICQTTHNTVLNYIKVYTNYLSKQGKNNFFGKKSKNECKQFKTLGLLSDQYMTIKDKNNKIIANKIININTYHYYSDCIQFVGVLGELLSQLPYFLMNSDDVYYIICDENDLTFGGQDNSLHCIPIAIYMKI